MVASAGASAIPLLDATVSILQIPRRNGKMEEHVRNTAGTGADDEPGALGSLSVSMKSVDG